MYVLPMLDFGERLKIEKSVREQLESERAKAKDKPELVKEIDDKLSSLDEIYRLEEAE